MGIITVISKDVELYLWDQDDGHFLKQADVMGSIGTRPSFDDYCIIAVTMKGQQLLSHRICSELNARWSTNLNSVTWNYTSRLGHLSSWCMRFKSHEDFKQLREIYQRYAQEQEGTISRKVMLKIYKFQVQVV